MLNLYGTLRNGGFLTANTYNAYNGSTIGQSLGGGTLNIYGDTTLSNTTAADPINVINGRLTLAAAELIGDTAAVTVASTGTLTLNGAETIGSLGNGTNQMGQIGGGTVDLGGNRLSVGGNNASTVFGGTIGGTGGLTKTGTGTLTLTGTNGYTGLTDVTGGVLALSGGNALADADAVQVAGGATLRLASNERVASISGAGTVELGANTLFLGTNDASSTLSGVVSGSGGITQTGAGTLTLTGANTYTGTTSVYGGMLALGASDVLADASTGVVISQSGRLISLIGVTDIVVVDTPDALLVTTTANAQRVKSVVDALKLSGRNDVL